MTKQTHLEIKEATATRAIFARVRGELPTIQLTFVTWEGDSFQFELPLTEAGKFLDMADSAMEAALPRRRRRNNLFGA